MSNAETFAVTPPARRKNSEVSSRQNSSFVKRAAKAGHERATIKKKLMQKNIKIEATDSANFAKQSSKDNSAMSKRLLEALKKLTAGSVPHPCGGFTTDDMQWQLGTAFLDENEMASALEELEEAKLIRFAGHDEDDAIGSCYELREAAWTQEETPLEKAEKKCIAEREARKTDSAFNAAVDTWNARGILLSEKKLLQAQISQLDEQISRHSRQLEQIKLLVQPRNQQLIFW
jgi:hypothetical protein